MSNIMLCDSCQSRRDSQTIFIPCNTCKLRYYIVQTTDEDEDCKNLCIICNIDMGWNNPRQLCGKTMCNNILNL
jgi:hypothetical protein